MTALLLRYIIGEIMYGGHVVEDWDRRLTSAYLQTLFQEGLLEGQPLFPQFDFKAPQVNMNHRQVRRYKTQHSCTCQGVLG